MNRRTKIFLAVAAVIVIIVILIVFLFIRESKQLTPEGGDVGEENVNEPAFPTIEIERQTPDIVVKELNNETKIKNQLSDLAIIFAERFGSYSNQGDFKNVYDLESFMTSGMKVWSEDFILKSKAQQGDTEEYVGTTTKALSTEFKSFDSQAGNSEVLVSTQRTEAKGTTSNTNIYYQDILIKFKKDGEEWKVSSVSWQ